MYVASDFSQGGNRSWKRIKIYKWKCIRMWISIYINTKSSKNNSPKTLEKRKKNLLKTKKQLNTEI